MAASLRRFDVQAKWAVVLGVFSVVPGISAVILALRNYEHELGQIVYGEKGLFAPTLLACILASLLSAVLSLLLGWNSAGQRRNDRTVQSWIGFFLGGSVLTLNIVLLLAFWMLRLVQPA